MVPGDVKAPCLLTDSENCETDKKSTCVNEDDKAYHWWELPQVTFLLRQKFCREKNILSRQAYFLSRQTCICRDKSAKMILVAAPASDKSVSM